ncbi:CinA family protein [Leucobacter denitrificans]|uniref:CinA family protein n=1 Tax=Leucobacter denitrificans TaxID=683042 RepID=A0A7G9S698_9MICO|nr:nicotinamide-nucleotide amidohydrolase family protein [Leucobacter denitrificans]QNN63373.1 CinA family protein [Leucobacter denitrificans]
MVDSALGNDVDRCIERLIAAVRDAGCTVGTAESLTGGQLAAAFSAAPEAGEWYRGGIVAYHPEVKYNLLETPVGPVVTPETAAAMACSTAHMLGANYTVALTGVGGPGPDEGQPPGTVYLATFTAGREPIIEHFRFDGEPVEVMEQTICAALTALAELIEQNT